MILRHSKYTTLSYLFLASLLLLIGILPTQAALSDNYLYDTWTTRDGLPHNSINAITQTQDGYLWFATWEGIARFNGDEFKIFTRGNESGLIDSGVRALYADPDGSLFAGGARGGLIQRKPHDWQALPSIKNLINTVLRDTTGGLWVGLQGEGLFFRGAGKTDNQLIIPAVTVYKLRMSKNGQILAATSKGLYLISSADSQPIQPITGLENIPVYCAVEDPQGGIIIASQNGIWRYENGQLSRFHEQLNNLRVATILIDHQGSYWFGTSSRGVYRFSNNQLSSLSEQDGLPHNNVLALYQDRENSIWIGTNGGLLRLRQAPFTTWDQRHGLKGNFIRTVLALPNGEVVVGSSNGLNVINQDQVNSYPLATDHSELSVLSLATRRAGGVWVGSAEHGLLQLDNKVLQPVDLEGLPSQQVRAIVEDPQGQLWVGTTAGLVKYTKNGSRELFTSENGLPDNYIMALSLDLHGQVWVGTGVGVAIIKNNQAQTLDIQANENAQYVFGFYPQEKYMWMTTDRGLLRYRFSDQNIAIIGQKQGLPLDKLFQVIPDSTGDFWLTSNRGIWRINAQEANAVADGSQSEINFIHYSEVDGMPSAQLNGGSNPAASRDATGQLWFATAKGVVATHPQRFKQIIAPQFPTTIEKVKAVQVWLDLASEQPITLPPGTQRLTFNFVGLGFIASQHILYRTQLEGLETDWIKRGSMRVAEYTNLDPGKYLFRVNAYYPYHENELNEASFAFTIQPYWWQRKELQVGLVILFLLTIALLVRWRLHHLRQSEMKLKHEVAQKTQALQIQASAFARQAREDTLTGLHNRLAFDEWVSKIYSLSSSSSILSIAILDIDHFKRINDSHTHLGGDKVLQKIGQALARFEQRNCFIARWGGEEFVIGIIGWQAEQVYTLCEEVNRSIKQQDYREISETLAISMSIGIVNGDTSYDIKQLLHCADQALFKVKNAGRDGISVHPLPNQ